MVNHYRNSDQDHLDQDYYCVLVADIKDSRTGDEARWSDLTNLMENIRVALNKTFEGTMEKEVVFTGGDSIQGVFYHIQEAYLYGRLLQKLFFPEAIRIGYGIGKVFSALENKNSNYSTGSAFVEANEALWWAKYLDFDIYVSPQNQKVMDINLIIELVSSVKSLQTDYQKELDLMVECIYPFWAISFDLPNSEIQNVLKFRNGLPTFQNSSNQNQNNSRMTTFISKWDEEPDQFYNYVEVDKNIKDYSEIAKEVNPQGIQTDIAYLTMSKRQTISKMYKLARIESIRKYEAIICQKLGEFYDDYSLS